MSLPSDQHMHICSATIPGFSLDSAEAAIAAARLEAHMLDGLRGEWLHGCEPVMSGDGRCGWKAELAVTFRLPDA